MPTFNLKRILAETFVSEIEFQPTLGSTNDRAIAIANSRADVPLPLLVLTERQTSGKGQGNRRWIATHGSLTFSLCLPGSSSRAPANATSHRDAVSIEPAGLLPLIVALATCHAIESIEGVGDVKIKWPNDLLIAGKKVGGILIEHVNTTAPHSTYVIGIGMNVNNEIAWEQLCEIQSTAKHAAEKSPIRPTSLKQQLGTSVDLEDLLIQVLGHLQSALVAARDSDALAIRGVEQRLVFLGQPVELLVPGQGLTVGECLGLGPRGELRLATDEGQKSFVSGRVIRFGEVLE